MISVSEDAPWTSMLFLCFLRPGHSPPFLSFAVLPMSAHREGFPYSSRHGHSLPLNLSPLPLLRPRVRGQTVLLDLLQGGLCPSPSRVCIPHKQGQSRAHTLWSGDEAGLTEAADLVLCPNWKFSALSPSLPTLFPQGLCLSFTSWNPRDLAPWTSVLLPECLRSPVWMLMLTRVAPLGGNPTSGKVELHR